MAEEAAFGAWLRGRRTALRLSQRELGQRACCSTETIKKIEGGQRRPSCSAAERLAAALGIPPPERPALVVMARGATSPATLVDPFPADPRPPAPTTSYIEHAESLPAVEALLRSPAVRLLTLTGPPGIGKTRLGLQVAPLLAAAFPGGTGFVSLGAIRDPRLVAGTLARTLGVREVPGVSWLEGALAYLRPREFLLMLDNFEQVLPAAPLVSALLAAAPGLKVLVTSRVALHLYGEHLWPVRALALPEGAALLPPAQLAEYEAIRLFVDRARAARADFTLEASNATAVAAICARLDGLPLAIELAAAGVRRLSPPALLARYTRRLDLAQDGPQDGPRHHQALRLAIDWSYDLLDPQARRLFCLLAIFRGGWTAAAAQAVWGGADGLGGPSGAAAGQVVWDTLTALHDQNLIGQRESAGELRFSMLETIQEYARERLEARGELAAARRQHAAYFRQWAEQVGHEWIGPQTGRWLDMLAVEHDNLRAALDWSAEDQTPWGPALGLGLTQALWRFWELRAYFDEGRRRLAVALAWARDAHPAAHARLLWVAGRFATFQGDYAAAHHLLAQAVARWQALGDRFQLSFALIALGNVILAEGDLGAAEALFAQSLAIRRELGQPRTVALALAAVASVAALAGALDRAAALLAEALSLARQAGNDYDLHLVLLSAADLAVRQEHFARAGLLLDESWTLSSALGHRAGQSECLVAYGRVAAAQAQPARAAQLFGAAVAQLEAAGARLSPESQIAYDRQFAAVHARLGDAACAAHFAAGRRLRPEDARAAALGVPKPDAPLGAAPRLTTREQAVLAAIASGLTNPQVAARLDLSRHTVNAHLRTIYSKLDVSTRSAATRYALDHGLV